MTMMKIVAQHRNPGLGIVIVPVFGKGRRFADFAGVAQAVGEVEAFNDTGVGLVPAQIRDDRRELGFTKHLADFDLDHPVARAVFEDLGINQVVWNPHLGNRRTASMGRAGRGVPNDQTSGGSPPDSFPRHR